MQTVRLEAIFCTYDLLSFSHCDGDVANHIFGECLVIYERVTCQIDPTYGVLPRLEPITGPLPPHPPGGTRVDT